MLATRLWQNTAKVHFNTEARPDGNRLVYGGHIISMARALSFNGLANAQLIAAINAGAHTSRRRSPATPSMPGQRSSTRPRPPPRESGRFDFVWSPPRAATSR
jgi:hypothetical protein